MTLKTATVGKCYLSTMVFSSVVVGSKASDTDYDYYKNMALFSYISQRLNCKGLELQGNMSKAYATALKGFPRDGTYQAQAIAGELFCHQYTPGPKDKAWMEKQDETYLMELRDSGDDEDRALFLRELSTLDLSLPHHEQLKEIFSVTASACEPAGGGAGGGVAGGASVTQAMAFDVGGVMREAFERSQAEAQGDLRSRMDALGATMTRLERDEEAVATRKTSLTASFRELSADLAEAEDDRRTVSALADAIQKQDQSLATLRREIKLKVKLLRSQLEERAHAIKQQGRRLSGIAVPEDGVPSAAMAQDVAAAAPPPRRVTTTESAESTKRTPP